MAGKGSKSAESRDTTEEEAFELSFLQQLRLITRSISRSHVAHQGQPARRNMTNSNACAAEANETTANSRPSQVRRRICGRMSLVCKRAYTKYTTN